MKPCGVMTLKLQERDFLIFQRICDLGYLSISQISTFVMHASPNFTRKRVRKLAQAGYLQKVTRVDTDATQVYIPSLINMVDLVDQKTWIKAQTALTQRRKLWHRHTPIHDTLVRDWSLRILELCPQASIELDYALSDLEWGYGSKEGEQKKVPDFVITFKSGKKVAFEIERSAKSSSIYKPIFIKALVKEDRPVVYLTEDFETKKSIVKVLNETLEVFKKQNRRPHSNIYSFEFSEAGTAEKLLGILGMIAGLEGVLSPVPHGDKQRDRAISETKTNKEKEIKGLGTPLP